VELTAVMNAYTFPLYSDVARRLLIRMRPLVIAGVAGLIVFLLLGNLLILSFHAWARGLAEVPDVAPVQGVENFQAVDDVLWRGARPTEEGYRNLAARGVTTIVDLRAEEGIDVPESLLSELGIRLVPIALRDGQTPTPQQVDRFLDIMRSAPGKVFVHCMAGVGRTGTMVAAYLMQVRGLSAFDALQRNLSVGPPSLEQIAFVADDAQRPNPLITAMSRVLDGPRRLWAHFT
jgi:protein-tyrosine phosphatase